MARKLSAGFGLRPPRHERWIEFSDPTTFDSFDSTAILTLRFTGTEWSVMNQTFFGSPVSISLTGGAIPGAEDRQRKIKGFDQEIYSRSRVLCVGAGGLISHIAPTLCRKGIGSLMILDDDEVDVSNLNRQRFYERDIGKNKAIRLARNLQRECIRRTQLTAYGLRFQEAVERGIDVSCAIAICGVDNNPSRFFASRALTQLSIPTVFTAVSADGDHGYAFIQERTGPCLGCVFPDGVDDERHPCPGTSAIADILQLMGAVSVYAVDSVLMGRRRVWNYRSMSLCGNGIESGFRVSVRENCPLRHAHGGIE